MTLLLPAAARRKNPIIAILLQCIPLLGVSDCALIAVDPDQALESAPTYLLLFFLFWGLGYAYIGRWGIFVAWLLGGPAFVFLCLGYVNVALGASLWDASTAKANVAIRIAAISESVLLAALILGPAVDVWYSARSRKPSS